MKSVRQLMLLSLLPALLALLAALWAGLVRLGWPWPPLRPTWTAAHGVLMIPAFFGGLISLERAVALRQRWPWLAPLFHGLGGLVLLAGGSPPWAFVFLMLGALVFVAMFVLIVRQHPATYTVLMAVSVVALAVGIGLWGLGWPVYRVVPWWMAFLVLTIAAERLELGRLQQLSRSAHAAFLGAVALVLGGLVFPAPGGARLVGVGLVALALWLLRYDVARKTVRGQGLPRYVAWALLTGYGWLAVGGGWMAGAGLPAAGLAYDGMLHAVLVGFVFSMIFGHAPIIFPALMGKMATFHPRLYMPLVGLHASLILRLLGDVLQEPLLRRWGGLFNAIFILYFLMAMARMVRSAKRIGEG